MISGSDGGDGAESQGNAAASGSREDEGGDAPREPAGRTGPAQAPISAGETQVRLVTSRTRGGWICVVLSGRVCGDLLQRHKETETPAECAPCSQHTSLSVAFSREACRLRPGRASGWQQRHIFLLLHPHCLGPLACLLAE